MGISATPKIIKLLKLSSDDGTLEGEINAESFNTVGAVYTPHSYLQKQQQDVKSFFAENGFVTVEFGSKNGMSMNRMKKSITASYVSGFCTSFNGMH